MTLPEDLTDEELDQLVLAEYSYPIAVNYRRLLDTVQPSVGHLGVYIGLQGTAAEIGLPRTNYWIYPSNDYDGALDAFLADPSKSEPVGFWTWDSTLQALFRQL